MLPAHYGIVHIKNDGKKGNLWDNTALDTIRQHCPASLAICCEPGGNYYILSEKGTSREDTQEKVRKLRQQIAHEIQNLPYEISGHLKIIEDSFVAPHIIYNLLLNSMQYDEEENKKLKLWNITGKCYIFMEAWKEKMKNGSIPALCIRVDKNMFLTVQVVTFSKIAEVLNEDRLKTRIKDKEKRKAYKNKIEQKARYRKSKSELQMIRDPKGEYIIAHDIRVLDETKSMISYMNLGREEYQITKVKAITELKEEFNFFFSDIFPMSFLDCKMYKEAICTYGPEDKKAAARLFNSALEQTEILLIDEIKTEASELLLNQLYEFLNGEGTKEMEDGTKKAIRLWEWASGLPEDLRHPKIHIRKADKPEANACNLVLIHSMEYYKKNEQEDIHNRDYVDESGNPIAIQHLVIENYWYLPKEIKSSDPIGKVRDSALKSILTALLFEVLIKQDNRQKKISLYDWSQLKQNEDVLFCIKGSGIRKCGKSQECIDPYLFMAVHSDGTFEYFQKSEEDYLFGSIPTGPISFDTMLQIEACFEESYSRMKCECVMVRGNDINAIYRTDYFTLPDTDKLSDAMYEVTKEHKKSLGRSKNVREEILDSILDIKSFYLDDEYHYVVGTIGYGMNLGIPTAAVPRKVVAVDGSRLFFPELIDILNVIFVRNKRLTSRPFPLKYIREAFHTVPEELEDEADISSNDV